MWTIFSIGILIGSLATSVIIFMVNHTNWPFYAAFGNPLKKLLINLPVFWLLLLIIFLAVAFYNIKHTKKGYKYNPLVIVLLSIMASIIIGSGVYAVGGGEKLEDIFYRRVPIYQQIIIQRGRMMLNPEHGVVAGVVVEVQENYIKIRDFTGKVWEVSTSTNQFQVGQRVHLLGKKISDDEFEGMVIKPWFRPHHHLFERNRPPRPLMIDERKF